MYIVNNFHSIKVKSITHKFLKCLTNLMAYTVIPTSVNNNYNKGSLNWK